MKNILLLTAILIAHQSKAQIDSYRLDSIRNPDFKRKLLEFDFRLGQSLKENAFDNNTTGTTRESNNRFDGNFQINYSSFKNTSIYQGNQDANISANAGVSNNTDQSNTPHASSIDVGFNYNSNNRFYISEKAKNHIVFNPSSSIRYDNSERKNNPNTTDVIVLSTNTTITSFQSEIGFGHGRLENVTDARIVLFILDDLRKNGLLTREPTIEEIDQIADLARYVRNQRFFDARIKRIYELTALDSIFNDLGILQNNNIQYHTILQDNWNYAVNEFRQTGYLFQYGIKPSAFNLWSNSNTEQKVTTDPAAANLESTSYQYRDQYGISLFSKYELYKPISQKLQNDFKIFVESGLELMNSNQNARLEGILTYENAGNTQLFSNSVGVRNDIGFFPTNRTYFKFGAYSNYSFRTNYRGELTTISNKNDNFNLGGNITSYYYFSPQLRVALNCSLEYNTNTSYSLDHITSSELGFNRRNNFSSNFSLRLTYKLF